MTYSQTNDLKRKLLDAALMHVAFDGWTETTFKAAVEDTETDPAIARALFPRGAVDLALAFHSDGDDAMVAQIKATDMSDYRFRDKVAAGVRFRLEAVGDKEAVRRGTTLFSLPNHAADGAKAIWGTADKIWTTLGDSSEDVNWYTKRVSLSAVYSSTVLFWLGDDSIGHQATWDFLDRRVENVMQFEKLKSQMKANPLLKPMLAGPNWLLSRIKAPVAASASDLPGQSSNTQ